MHILSHAINNRNCFLRLLLFIEQEAKIYVQNYKFIEKNIINTGSTEVCLTENNFIDTNNIKLLHKIVKDKQIDLLEIIEIKKPSKQNKNITNEHIEYDI